MGKKFVASVEWRGKTNHVQPNHVSSPIFSFFFLVFFFLSGKMGDKEGAPVKKWTYVNGGDA